MTQEEKKIITWEEHPGRVARGHKLAALLKKKKRRNIAEQRTVYSTVYSTVFSTVYSTVYRTTFSSVYNIVKWYLCLWRWYTYCPCHWRLCIFCIQHFSSKKTSQWKTRSTTKTTWYALEKNTINEWLWLSEKH